MRTATYTLALASACFFSTQLHDEDTAHEKVLKRFIGTWDVAVMSEPTGGERSSYKVVSRRMMSRAGGLVRFKDDQPEGLPEFHMLLTYDAEKENYPGVFMLGPSRSNITGTWKEEKATMSFNVESSNDLKITIDHTFKSPDRAEVSIIVKNSDGVVVSKTSSKQVRRKTND